MASDFGLRVKRKIEGIWINVNSYIKLKAFMTYEKIDINNIILNLGFSLYGCD